MSLQAVEDALYAALAESRSSTLEAVRSEAGADGRIDSLEGLELILAAETQFGVQIGDAEMTAATCSSVTRLARLVASKIDSA
jgi:acyl carrier protein